MTGMFEHIFPSKKKTKEPAIFTGSLDDVDGVPDLSLPSVPFTPLQARLCPSTLYVCSPRTMIWYNVTIANLLPVNWQKGAIDSLVIDPMTKDTLRGLVEEHKKGNGSNGVNDFIQHKGQVRCLHHTPAIRACCLSCSGTRACITRTPRSWKNIDCRYIEQVYPTRYARADL